MSEFARFVPVNTVEMYQLRTLRVVTRIGRSMLNGSSVTTTDQTTTTDFIVFQEQQSTNGSEG